MLVIETHSCLCSLSSFIGTAVTKHSQLGGLWTMDFLTVLTGCQCQIWHQQIWWMGGWSLVHRWCLPTEPSQGRRDKVFSGSLFFFKDITPIPVSTLQYYPCPSGLRFHKLFEGEQGIDQWEPHGSPRGHLEYPGPGKIDSPLLSNNTKYLAKTHSTNEHANRACAKNMLSSLVRKKF